MPSRPIDRLDDDVIVAGLRGTETWTPRTVLAEMLTQSADLTNKTGAPSTPVTI